MSVNPSDVPFKVGKILMDEGWSTLDALAVVRAMKYAAYIDHEGVKGAIGTDTMFRWQTWKDILD